MLFISNGDLEYLPVDEARRLLRDGIEDEFHDAMHWAWGRWKAKHPDLWALPSRTLRATGIHELVVGRLAERLDGHARVVRVDPQPGIRRAHYLIKDSDGIIRVIIQTKKFDVMNRTRNIRTKEAILFDAQQPVLGIPVGPRITLGYRVVESGTGIVTEAAYRRHGALAWKFELCTDRVVEQMHLPAAAAGTKRRVTGKAGIVPVKREGEGTSGKGG